ncbi:MAG: sulfite exporter TauE/SafE family protein [Candidatus Melainabacteria bacterium]|nr:MAG: sulfite exporter TauE/SafE family protein [Candidatus Melainabacteria bacterium]
MFDFILQFLSFLVIALLYSSVGHGGATGYLAILSMTKLPSNEIATTALVLNVLTATVSLLFFIESKHFKFKVCAPLLATSIPAAFLGGMISLHKGYFLLLAVVLLVTALKMFYDSFHKPAEDHETKPVNYPQALGIGAALGLLSGMAGIGGGVFLSPVLLFLNWTTVKQTSATAAIFIVCNSISGLVGRAATNRLEFGSIMPYLVASFIGAIAGSFLGSKKLKNNILRRALGAVLIVAVYKLLLLFFK